MQKRRTAKRAEHANLSEIVSLVFVMGQSMREKAHKKFDHSKCSLLEFEALRYVHDKGDPPMRDIARKFHVTPPAATLLIDGLVKRGLFERIVDSKDRRSVRVGLTKEGKRFMERGMATKVKELKKMFGVLTPSERTQFAAILKKITKNGS